MNAHAQTRLDPVQLAALRLVRSRRVGPVTYHRLIAEHGDAGAALRALPDIAAAAGVEKYAACPEGVARAEMARGAQLGARLLVHGQPGYPALLSHLADAPPVLWALGDITLLARPMVALVGARNASSLGLRMARQLGTGLGQAGQVVVSGLARGIDAEAHRAALSTGTVAVMAGGVDILYPMENAALAGDIRTTGCLVSEQPFGTEPQSRHFPMRNRIIAGLAQAVVVVEAAAKSGSLLTARAAADIGRDVLAVPGHPFDARAAGSNMLIRDGATLIRSAADVVEAIGTTAADLPPRPTPRPEKPAAVSSRPDRAPVPTGSSLDAMILAQLGPSPLPEDQLIRDLALPPAIVAQALVGLELDGQIERLAGGLLTRLR